MLVVDDDIDLCTLTAHMLIAEGYRVLEAGGASEAIGVLAKQDVDVLLTDVRMPGLGGIVLAQQAKRMQPKIVVIFTTGAVSLRQSDAQRHGTIVFKPYHALQLDSEITKALGEAGWAPSNAF